MSKHKTPLRYPGGKQKLTPFIEEIIRENGLYGGDYVEPYAGGAGVAMQLLLNGIVSRIHINDSDLGVYAFWRSILRFPDEFCRRVKCVSLTIKEWRKQREVYQNPYNYNQLDFGFAVFFLNRCNRSGILNAGVIGGIQQDGEWKIDARFPRSEMIKRIEAIAARRSAIRVKNLDADKYIKSYIPKLPRKTLVYLDPPYFEKAERLYSNHYANADHKRLAKVIQDRIKRPWVVSYDNAPEIVGFYKDRRQISYGLQYNAARAYKGKEIFVFSDKIRIPENSSMTSVNYALKRLSTD